VFLAGCYEIDISCDAAVEGTYLEDRRFLTGREEEVVCCSSAVHEL